MCRLSSLKTKKDVSLQALDLPLMTVCMPQKTDVAVSVALSQIKETNKKKRLETSQV